MRSESRATNEIKFGFFIELDVHLLCQTGGSGELHTSILGVPQPPIGVFHQSHCHVAQRLAVNAAERRGLAWGDCSPAML